MKSLKTNAVKLLSLLLIVAFASCKKDGSPNPSSDDDGSFLKGYVIVGKYKASVNSQDVQLPYFLAFGANAKAVIYSGYITRNGNYTYKNGVLTIVWSPTATDTFNISNKKITGFNGASTLTTYTLQQIPASNQLSGNSYSGSLRTPGNNIFLFSTFKFNDTQYGQTGIGDPVINTDYNLLGNIAGYSITGGNGKITFFVLIDGKMEVAVYNPTNANGDISVSYGTYTKK